MRLILEFLKKLWTEWVALITGSGVVALIALWEHRAGTSLKFSTFATVASIFILWAFYRMWRKERLRAEGEKAHHDSPVPSPTQAGSLSAKIDWVCVAKEGGRPDEAQVIVVAKLTNRGLPSTVDGWTLIVQSPDGDVKEATMCKISSEFTVEQDGERRVFAKGDALYEKSFGQPIPTGGSVRGVLWFHLMGVAPEKIAARGYILTLRALDAFGAHVIAAAMFGPSEDRVPVVFAGLSA